MVHPKVKAAGFAALVAAFVVGWVVKELPGLSAWAPYLQAAVTAVVTAGAAVLAGWLAKHEPPVPPVPPAGPTM